MGFASEILGVALWSRQREIAVSVARHPRTAVRSAHKVGKSALVACLALWWVLTRPRGLVVLTSASHVQVRSVLWRELRRIYNAAGGGARFGASMPNDPSTGLIFDDDRMVIGISVAEPERVQGFSSPELLVCVDEASGFSGATWLALQGNLAGGGRALLTGNPTRSEGVFFDAFNGAREHWSGFHISAHETPNVTGAEPAIPGLATPEWIAGMVAEYGAGDEDLARLHPVYQVRVLGDFATTGSDCVIPMGLVDAALARWDSTQPNGSLVLGVDVARFGDDESVIQPLRGAYAYPSTVVAGADSIALAGRVLDVARELGGHATVAVDSIGVGSGVIDQLNASGQVHVIAVDVGSRSTATSARDGLTLYALLRDQVWFAVREWLLAGGALPPDTRRDAELLGCLFSYDVRGRIQVEKKSALRQRLKRSPDRADALALACHGQVLGTYAGPLGHPDLSRTSRGSAPRAGKGW